jgi:hypothetical protein
MRVFFPKYLAPGSTSAAGTSLSDAPSSVVFAYDNDAIIPASYADTVGHTNSKVFYTDGDCAYGATALPLSIISGSVAAGGSKASAEWCDTANPTTMLGGIGFVMDRLYTWTGAPSQVTAAVVIHEWDVTFIGKEVS